MNDYCFYYLVGVVAGLIVGVVNTWYMIVAYYSNAAAGAVQTAEIKSRQQDREIDNLQDRLEHALDYIAKLKERTGYDGRDVDELDN